jgi:ribosomal protein L32
MTKRSCANCGHSRRAHYICKEYLLVSGPRCVYGPVENPCPCAKYRERPSRAMDFGTYLEHHPANFPCCRKRKKICKVK